MKLGVSYSLSRAFIVLLFFAVYLDFPLFLGGFLLPSFLAVCLFFPLILFVLRRYGLSLRELRYIASVLVFFSCSAVFWGDFDWLGERFLSLLQAIFAVVIAWGSYVLAVRNRDVFRRLCSWSLFFLFAFSILEVAGITKSLSDFVRFALFPPEQVSYLYTSVDRDLELTGFERPKVFSAEPSYVSIAFFVCSVGFLKLNPHKKNLALVLFLALGMLVMFRSPINLAAIACCAYIYFFEGFFVRLGFSKKVFIFLVLGFLIYFFPVFLDFIGRPLVSFAELPYTVAQWNSQTVRFLVPAYTVLEVLSEHPFLGVGFGGKSAIEAISTLYVPAQLAMGTNNLMTPFMYFGLLGGLLYFCIIFSLFRGFLGRSWSGFLVVFILFSSMLGGFEAVRYWYFLFFLMSAYKIASAEIAK